MGTLKKFCIYFIIFVIAFLLINCLTYATMYESYKDINYEIKETSPQISVNDCKAIYSQGYINGSITNDTGNLIPLKYLKVNLYDTDGIYLGSEYKELKNFYPDETINFDTEYHYNNVDKVVFSITDNKKGNDKKDNDKENLIVKPIITRRDYRFSHTNCRSYDFVVYITLLK